MVVRFQRFANIPGVEYSGSFDLGRNSLLVHDAVPSLDEEGSSATVLRQTDSAYLAKSTPTEPYEALSATQIALRQLMDALEQPGEPGDYHFVIQNCCQELWRWQNRFENPETLTQVEQLCWLDIHLIEAYPECISHNVDGETRYFQVWAFGILTYLYEQEGYLYEALDVAEKGARFGRQGSDVGRLRAKIAELEAEGVG